MSESCASCRFFRLVFTQQGSRDASGECRRFPPIYLREEANEMGPDFDANWVFPMVGEADWCGEYRLSDKP